MSTKPFLREPPLTAAFLLVFVQCGTKKKKRDTLKLSNMAEGLFLTKAVEIQDKALKLIMDKDFLEKLCILKMTLKFSAYTIKH